MLDAVVAHDGAVLADEQRAELAVPAVAVAHFMLRSSESQMSAPATPRSRSAAAAKRIITSGPHEHRHGARRIERGPPDQPGDDADLPVPSRVGRVDDQLDVEPAARRHASSSSR